MPLITKSVVINNNAPVGCPPGGTEDQLLAKNSNIHFDYKWVNNCCRPYKVYSALFAQTGVNAPVITVLENTIGNIVWSYNSTGTFHGTLVDAFTQYKTNIERSQIGILTILPNLTIGNYYSIIRNSDDVVILTTFDDKGLSNGMLINTFIEIRVYND